VKNIVVFYQNSSDSIFIRSICIGLQKHHYNVFFISYEKKGSIHEFLEYENINTYSLTKDNENTISIYKAMYRLIKILKSLSADVVFSHLQKASLIALFSQYFIKAKVVPTRHHIDDVIIQGNRNGILQDKLVNFLSKKIIVLNQHAKEFMIKNEKVNSKKLVIIPYGYDFDLYSKSNLIDLANSESTTLKIGIVGRINENKNTEIAIEILKKVIEKGQNALLYIIGDGPLLEKLKSKVVSENLSKSIIFTGNVLNTMDYIYSMNIILHPSISEASNQVVKEAGLQYKTVICVKGVGDFDEYITNSNGFLFDSEVFVESAVKILTDVEIIKQYKIMGEELHKTVLNKFNINAVTVKYKNFIENEL